MKPEAGQWWVNDKSGDNVYFIGRCASGIMVFQVEGDAIEHGDLDWSGWRLSQPQPAEDPDEWVVQDRVPVRPDVDRVSWNSDEPDSHIMPFLSSLGKMHGFDNRHGDRLRVFCRRRDLPKVEQAEQCAACDAPAETGTCSPEQWPKYYKPSQPSPVAMIRRDNDHYCTVFNAVGGQRTFIPWCYEALPEITEAEAMALLKKPEPQPQKTRVRLWKFCGSETVVASAIEKTGDWQEIHHDSEGFYVEG